MQRILNQRKIFLTKRFEITERSLKVTVQSKFTFTESEYFFENLSNNVIRKKTVNFILLGILALCIIGMGITVLSHFFEKDGSSVEDIFVYVTLGIIFLVLFLATRQSYINLFTIHGLSITMFPNIPNAEAVNTFLTDLFAEQKRCFLKKYLSTDMNLTDEQLLNNLQWLWSKNILSEAEFDELKDNLKSKPKSFGSMGFKFDAGTN